MAAQDNWRELFAVWSRPHWRAALAAAMVSDLLSFGIEAVSLGLAEPVQIGVDLITAVVIVALVGFRWGLAVPLIVEAVPVAAAFPTWTLAVVAYAALDRPTPGPPALGPGSST